MDSTAGLIARPATSGWLRIPDNQDPSPVRMPHQDTGELVLVTREEILTHAEADGACWTPTCGTGKGRRAGTAD